MNAFFFGRSERQLFGAYDPPAAGGSRTRGVVLCNAWGSEYVRSHKAMRRLATLLSRSGLHVMRFDYFGTGDSAGESTDGRIAQWVEDTANAVEELKDTAGVTRVSLVGLRLGAAIAALTAAKRKDVDRLVLWEPVLDGAGYAHELVGAGVSVGGGVPHVSGYPFAPALREELDALSVDRFAATRASVSIVASQETAAAEALRAAREALSLPTVVEVQPAPPVWKEEHDFGTGAVPVSVLQRIVSLLS